MKDRLLDRIIRFDKLLGLTALTIALVAAFFSVYGISTLFAGAFVATAIMASSLEVGKLVAVTFLYRYWKKTNFLIKTYLSIATFVLMLVTSLGIFGYLSAAYQKSALEFKANQDKIVMVESQVPFYTNLIAQSEARIKTLNNARVVQEARLSEAMTNAFLSRNPLQLKQLQEQTIELINKADEDIRLETAQIRTNQLKIISINEEVNGMRFASAGNKDIQTFNFVAEQFEMTLDTVAKYFIMTLIFVFDPLAVALILAYNIVVFKKEERMINPQPEPPQPIRHPAFEEPRQKIVEGDGEPIPDVLREPAPVPSPVSEPAKENFESEPHLESKAIPPDPYYARMFKL